jgi:hypothetical protein
MPGCWGARRRDVTRELACPRRSVCCRAIVLLSLHCVAAAGLPVVARRDYRSRLSKGGPASAGGMPPPHRTFPAERVPSLPPQPLAAAGFPIRLARAVPHDSGRRGKAGLQIPPQRGRPASARHLPPGRRSPASEIIGEMQHEEDQGAARRGSHHR